MKTLGQEIREEISKNKAEKEALNILRVRHIEEYEAIFKKRFEIIHKQWRDENVRTKKV